MAGLAILSPATRWVATMLDHQPSLCPLQAVAGMACPSCGGTRAALHLLAGDPATALSFNAGATLFLCALAVLVMAGSLRPGEILGVANRDRAVADFP